MSESDSDDIYGLRDPDFPHQTVDLDQGWTCVGKLGTGVSGNTWALVKRNQNGTIIDRMAVKDTKTQLNSVSWPEGGMVPFEVTALYRLRECEHVVRIRNWKLIERGLKYRIYMELCPFGTLDNVIPRHRQMDNYFAPEAFIWCAFESLALAGLFMERGGVGPTPPGHWELIVHRDMKFGNVFLGLNSSDTWRGYPSVKLGDFGNCEVIPKDVVRPSNAFPLRRYHHQSPEERTDHILGADAQGFENPQRLTSRTNVWAVGDVMWSMLQRRDGDPELRHWKGDKPMPHAKWNKLVDAHYSAELQRLILQCLEYRPQDRPSFDEIFERINAPDLAHGMRNADLNDPGFVGKHGLLIGHEMYRQGFSVEDEVQYGELTHLFDDMELYPNVPRNKAHEMQENVDDELADSIGDPGGHKTHQTAQHSSGAMNQSAQVGAKRKSDDDSVQFVSEVIDLTSPPPRGQRVVDLTSPAVPSRSDGNLKRRRSAQLSAEHSLPSRPRRRRKDDL